MHPYREQEHGAYVWALMEAEFGRDELSSSNSIQFYSLSSSVTSSHTNLSWAQMEAELGALRQRLSQAEAQLAEEARRSREAAARTRELETAEQAYRAYPCPSHIEPIHFPRLHWTDPPRAGDRRAGPPPGESAEMPSHSHEHVRRCLDIPTSVLELLEAGRGGGKSL